MNPTDRSRPTPSAGRERPKILVIDDETLVRQSFRDYLEDLDYQVIEAENGRLGLDLFFREHPDLVLVDLRMPLVDGIEVLHQVKSRVPATPVIVVSGTGVIADAVEALHLGADDYLLKPLEDLSILRHTIEGALDRARLVRENQAYQTQLEQLVRARTEQLEQANRQLSRINQRLRLIVESTQKLSICRDVRTFGAQLLREFARNMRAAGGSLYLVRETGLELVDTLDNDRAPASLPFPLKPACVFQRALSARCPVLIQDLAEQAELGSSGWTGYRNGSLLVFPLTDENGEVLAALSLHNRTDPPFVEQDRELGSILASFSCETLRAVRMSEALQHSVEMFRTITGSAQDAIFMVDAEGRISYWNRAAEQIFGWTVAEAIGRAMHTLLAPGSESASARALFAGGLDTDRAPSGRILTTTAVRKDGAAFPAELSVAWVEIQGCWSVVGILRDVTERQRAEERIQLLATAADQAAENIVVIDPRGIIVHVNPAFEQTSGYRSTEAVGQALALVEDREHPESGYPEMQRALEARQTWRGFLYNRRRDGTRYTTDVTLTPVRDAGGRVMSFVSVQRDVSRERELENRLRQAQKMEAIGTLAGGIAHDFNNILNAILGYSELALMQLEKESRSRRNIEKILQAGERAADLVKQILTISRQVEVRKKPVLVQPIIKESLKLLRSTLPSTIAIQSSIDPRCGPVLADPTQIHQVIMNLCTNAYHAMRDRGGVLEVAMTETTAAQSDPFVSPVPGPGPCACISVRDSGCGMDEATMKRIFDPYFTTKNKGEGTGLGLATVHGIVQSHGGTVQVESAPGAGSRFRIWLPLCSGAAATATPQPEDLDRWRGTGRIMLVDDEPAVTEVGEAHLVHSGYQVSVFNDSREAWEAFQSRLDRFDLVITDLTMPRLTGLDLARLMLGVRPDLPIIICSGYGDTAKIQAARGLGVREYVTKPISGLELLKTVHRALHPEDSRP